MKSTPPLSSSVSIVVGSGMIRKTTRSRYGRPPSACGKVGFASKTTRWFGVQEEKRKGPLPTGW